MEDTGDNISSKKRVRPAQKLYVPPAQRTRKTNCTKKDENPITKICKTVDGNLNPSERVEALTNGYEKHVQITETIDLTDDKSKRSTNEELVIMLKNIRTGPDKNESDIEKEDSKRAIQINVNKKPKPFIKPVNKNDVLQIDSKNISNKSNKKSPVKLMQVANWEDLFIEEDQEDNYNNQLEYENERKSDSEPEDFDVAPKIQELEHVIELYDFPSTFKTQDIMQIYNEINKESIYIKWCDETHALLVLGSAIQAQRALGLKHDIIKSRPMSLAGPIAKEVAAKCDLKPAMKRPQTSMHTARRMITTALGTKSQISKEVQEKEREALRLAKELKKAQRQSERDAWEGNPRPSTA